MTCPRGATTGDNATAEKSAPDTATLGDTQRIVAMIPALLSAPRQPEALKALLTDPLMTTAQEISRDWQQLSGHAAFYEMGATTHGVQRDRMTEVIGLRASIGEQVAIARAALIECWLWHRKRQDNEAVSDEMCHRALADLLTSFCVSAGHGLLNLTGRMIALDNRTHPKLLDTFGATLLPHSDDHDDWLSCNKRTVARLRKVAAQAPMPKMRTVADGVTDLVNSTAWHEVYGRRGTDFHRRRAQSHGVAGVPLRSLWEQQPGGAWQLSGGPTPYDDGKGLALKATSYGHSAIERITACMSTLDTAFEPITAAIFAGEWD